jgi:hypothetical protein
MSVLYEHAQLHPAGYREIDPVRVAQAGSSVRIVDVREPRSPKMVRLLRWPAA